MSGSRFWSPPTSRGYDDVDCLPAGTYAVLLLPTSTNSPLPYNAFQVSLTQPSKVMFYSSFDTRADGSFLPTTTFQRVSPSVRIGQGVDVGVAPEVHGSQATPSPSRRDTRSASARPTRFSSASPDNIPVQESKLQRYKRRFHGSGNDTSKYTLWYQSSGPYTLTSPLPMNDQLEIGTIFIHTDTRTSVMSAWVRMQGEKWQAVDADTEDFAHPTLRDRFLWVRTGGDPSWITHATLKSYRRDAEGKASSFRPQAFRESSVKPERK